VPWKRLGLILRQMIKRLGLILRQMIPPGDTKREAGSMWSW